MAHRSTLRPPIFMEKSLEDRQVCAKNMAELAYKYAIRDARTLEQVFTSPTKDRVIHAGGLAIRSYNLARIHDRACVIYIAKREAGKSVHGYQVLATKSYFPTAYVTSTTDGPSGFYQTVVRHENVHTDYDPEYQAAIIESQKACADVHNAELARGRIFDPRCIMIEDDCAFDRRMHEDKNLDRVATSGRHFHIFEMVMVQRMHRVSPTFRDNCDLIVLYNTKQKEVRKAVWLQYASFIDEDRFFEIWDTVTAEPYHALMIVGRYRDLRLPLEQQFWHFRAHTVEAVDALLGGGEVSDDGEVTKPAVRYWVVGKRGEDVDSVCETQRRPVEAPPAEGDELLDDGWLPTLYVPHFEASPISLSEWYLRRKRVTEEERKAAIVKKVINSAGE
jgi:hypothetical protein